MKCRYPALMLCLLLICSIFIPISLGDNVKNIPQQPVSSNRGNTLYVGGSGGDNYTTIQDAINDAVNGDTVYVYDDSSPYNELLVIDKSINLIGEDKNTTVIDGNYKGTVVDIQEDNVVVSGFTILHCNIQNQWDYNVVQIINCNNVEITNNIISVGYKEYGDWNAGIFLKGSSNNIIHHNKVYNNLSEPCFKTSGIEIYDGSTFNNISFNEVFGYIIGIGIISNNNLIYCNNIHDNKADGILIDLTNDNRIFNNTILSNPSNGIAIRGSSNNIISDNIISDNGDGGEFDSGITAWRDSSDNQLINNHITENNPTGIYLLNTYNDYISRNQISNNIQFGIYLDFSFKTAITKNNINDNPINCDFITNKLLFNNRWDKNFYSDYNTNKRYHKIDGTLSFLLFFTFPWFNIDWHPAQEPYDIEV